MEIDFYTFPLPLLSLLVFSALILAALIFLHSLDHSCHALFHYYIPLVHPTLVTDSLSSPATLCCLQSALRGSTGTAAASRVHSVCTAPGHAIMSRATVSACLALLARCATKASSLLCPFDLYPALSRTVKFIHCEV